MGSFGSRCRSLKNGSDTQNTQNDAQQTEPEDEPKVLLKRSDRTSKKIVGQKQPQKQRESPKRQDQHPTKTINTMESNTKCSSWRETCSSQFNNCCQDLACTVNPVTKISMCSYGTNAEISKTGEEKNNDTISNHRVVGVSSRQKFPQRQQPKLKNIQSNTVIGNIEKHNLYEKYLSSKEEHKRSDNNMIE